MKTEKELIDINNEIYKLLIDEKLSYMEVFSVLETVKSYFVGKLIQANMHVEVMSVRRKE